MSVHFANFMGTMLNYPVHIKTEKLIEIMEEAVSAMETHSTPQFIYLQMKYWRELLLQHSINDMITEYVVKKVCSILKLDVISFHTTYFSSVRYLLKVGFKEDFADTELNGFVFIVSQDEKEDTQEKFIQVSKTLRKDLKKDIKKCSICSIPAKKSCSVCKSIYYCCREHQTQDWKRHKKECGKL